jgi:hypothetical protein
VTIRNIAVTPHRETARAIPLGKTNVGAVIISRRASPRDEMKAPMLPRVTADRLLESIYRRFLLVDEYHMWVGAVMIFTVLSKVTGSITGATRGEKNPTNPAAD